MLNVLFVTSEAYPFSKSGGLGDVKAPLPKSFPDDVKTQVILPYYSTIPEELRQKIKPLKHFQMWMSDTLHYCGLLTAEHEGVTFYFIDNEAFFKRPSLYGYYDDGERFSFFAERCWTPCHCLILPGYSSLYDWQTAAVAYLLANKIVSFSNKGIFIYNHNILLSAIFAFIIVQPLSVPVFTSDLFYEKSI